MGQVGLYLLKGGIEALPLAMILAGTENDRSLLGQAFQDLANGPQILDPLPFRTGLEGIGPRLFLPASKCFEE